jgi:predicted metal-binding membrane protein
VTTRALDQDRWILIGLLGLATLAWGWTIAGARGGEMADMPGMAATPAVLDLAAFLAGWVAMMAAMMFPAIVPVVRLYALAASRGRAAPVPVFVAGYLIVWSAAGFPAWLAWRALRDPLAAGATWVAWIAAVVLLAAAAYQWTPLKTACLRHCRSPIGFFAQHGRAIGTAQGALRAGVVHGAFCLGCCWAFMTVLVAFGTMHLAWMAALAALILVEKTMPHGEPIGRVAGAAFAVLAALLLLRPSLLMTLT